MGVIIFRMINVSPLSYERFAVLVSPLLVPGHAPTSPVTKNGGPAPITRTASTSHRESGENTLNSRSPRDNPDLTDNADTRLRQRIPVKHPDPTTGRGQNFDFYAYENIYIVS